MRHTPGAANRALALLSKMLNLAEKWGYCRMARTHVAIVETNPEHKIERFLGTGELARLGDALAEAERTRTEMPSVVASIRLLAFTGCRLSEILTLRWDWINRDPNNPFVIGGRNPGTHLVNLRKPRYRIRSEAGLEGVRIHDLRHSFASFGAGAGLS